MSYKTGKQVAEDYNIKKLAEARYNRLMLKIKGLEARVEKLEDNRLGSPNEKD